MKLCKRKKKKWRREGNEAKGQEWGKRGRRKETKGKSKKRRIERNERERGRKGEKERKNKGERKKGEGKKEGGKWVSNFSNRENFGLCLPPQPTCYAPESEVILQYTFNKTMQYMHCHARKQSITFKKIMSLKMKHATR